MADSVGGADAQRLRKLLESGEIDDLREALTLLRALLARTPADDPVYPEHLNDLGFVMQLLACATEDVELLRSAVAACSAAVAASPEQAPVHCLALGNYRNALLLLFAVDQDPELLYKAVAADRAGVELAVGEPNHLVFHYMLCQDLAELAVRTGDRALLADLAVQAEAAARATTGVEDRSAVLFRLVQLVLGVSDRFPEDPLAATIIVISATALASMRDDDPLRPSHLQMVWGGMLLTLPGATVPGVTDNSALLRELAGHAQALIADPATDPSQRLAALIGRGRMLHLLADRTGDTAPLRESVDTLRAALRTVDPGDPMRAELLAELMFALTRLAERDVDAVRMAELVDLAAQAVAVMPGGARDADADLLTTMRALGSTIDGEPDESALRTAVESQRAVLNSFPVADPRRLEHLITTAQLLIPLFDLTGELALLDEAVRYGREAYAAAAHDNDEWSTLLTVLGAALQKFYDTTTDVTALEEARVIWRSLSQLKAGSPEENLATANYAMLTGESLRWSMDIETMREMRRVFDELGPDQFGVVGQLINGGTALAMDQNPDLTAIGDIVNRARLAIADMSGDEPLHAASLSSFAMALVVLAVRTGDSAVLEEALGAARESTDRMPRDHPGWIPVLFNKVHVLKASYEATDEVEVLQEAVDLARAGVADLPADHSGRSGYLSLLGLVSMELAARTANPGAVRDAIRFGRDSIAAARGDLGRGVMLSNFGHALESVYARTGQLAAIKEAVQVAREVVTLTPRDLFDYPRVVGNLGTLLSKLYSRTGNPAHLDEAIQHQRAALAAVPVGQPGRANLLANLAGSLRRRFTLGHEAALLDEAIALHRQAVVESSAAAPLERGRHLAGLAGDLARLYRDQPSPQLLAEWLGAAREGVAITPAGHPMRAVRQATLGSRLLALFVDSFDVEHYNEALEALREAVSSTVAPVSIRISAAKSLAQAESMSGDYDRAQAALEHVIALLPTVATRALDRGDREHWLEDQAGLAADIAATAVAANQPERAVELLEQCRGFLLGEAMDDRRDLTALRERSPRLARELEDVRTRLTMTARGWSGDAETTVDDPVTVEAIEAGEQREALADRWSELLHEIRTLPGFEGYLAPPAIDRLSALAQDGPIVVYYACEQSDPGGALIISADPREKVRVLPLPGLGNGAAARQAERLTTVLALREGSFAARARAETELHELLEWLWDAVAGPVLAELGFDDRPEPPPRLWWCPVGQLAGLPIQAAGYHRDGGTRTVLDRTVSSVIATVRALEHGLVRPNSNGAAAVLVVMPETEDAAALPGTVRETSEIAALLGDSSMLCGPEATREAVAAALLRHPIAHFACHAVAELDAPGESRLLLHDHRTASFTVSFLERLHLPDAELTYLSACGTTRTNSALVDESIHLTAAIHLAGYRRVVGTLWNVNDRAAAEVAVDFYRHLTADGTRPARTELSAQALNAAVRRCRERRRAFPSQWAAHLYYGI